MHPLWNECGQSLSSEEEGEGREGESRGVEWSGVVVVVVELCV